MWQWVWWSGVGDASVGSMRVVELLVLVLGVAQVRLVPDQCAVEEFAAAASEPAFHDRVRSWDLDAAEDNLDACVGRDGVEQGRELPVPVVDQEACGAALVFEVMTRFLTAWVTQEAVGCAVAPRILVRRLVCSMTARTYRCAGQGGCLEEVVGQ